MASSDHPVSWQEVLAVVVLGAGIAFAVSRIPVVHKIPLFPVAVGTGLLTIGYLAATRRPNGGWPLQARIEAQTPKLLTVVRGGE